MHKQLKHAGLKISIAATVLLAASYVGAATVPNTLVPDTPATAADINENFQALADAITALEDAGAGSDFSGYSTGFSADGTPKNVSITSRPSGGGGTIYDVRIFYESSSETVSIGGAPTQRPFFGAYPYVETDISGNVIAVFNYIETPDTDAYIDYNIEESTYSISGVKISIDDDTLRESWVSMGGKINFALATQTLAADGTFVSNYTRTQIRSLSGPFTVNGMTFDEVRVENQLGNDRLRIRAKGIGLVFQSQPDRENRELIYYRANGSTGGSLVGTPFANGAALAGVFFTP